MGLFKKERQAVTEAAVAVKSNVNNLIVAVAFVAMVIAFVVGLVVGSR